MDRGRKQDTGTRRPRVLVVALVAIAALAAVVATAFGSSNGADHSDAPGLGSGEQRCSDHRPDAAEPVGNRLRPGNAALGREEQYEPHDSL